MSTSPRPPRTSTVAIGRDAESRVAEHYRIRGFELVARNVRVGRLEIDLILRRGGLIVICEVKHRATDSFGHPAIAVDLAKQERIRRAAAGFLESTEAFAVVRFDVATIVGDPNTGRVTIFPSAF